MPTLRLAKRVFLGALIVCAALVILNRMFLGALGSLAHKRARKLYSQEAVALAVYHEKWKLGIRARTDVLVASDLPDALCSVQAMSLPNGETYYQIKIRPDVVDTACLKHELYHIYAGHCNQPGRVYGFWQRLAYWFYYEPTAQFYVLWGWRL